jgi:glycosyltransferase involved in cell wall biosynthesis
MYQMGCALTRMGHEAVTVTSRSAGLPETEQAECGRVYRIYDRAAIRSDQVAGEVLDIARRHGVDLIEGADHHGELAPIIRRKDRPLVLIKIHGSNPIRVLQESHVLHGWQRVMVRLAHLRNWQQTRAERFSIENADLAIMPSARIGRELQRQGLRLPARSAVIPNPIVPYPGFVSAAAPTPTLLMVGRLDIGKGIQYLPALVARLTSEMPDLVLEIAGEDSYARGLGSLRNWLSAQLGPHASRVRFLGRLGPQDLDRAYARCWALILPSRWDNFPTVLLEAMVRGKPVVASPHGGMPEILEGTEGVIALPESEDFAAAVLGFLRDSGKRQRAGATLRRRAESVYSPESVVRRYIEFVSQEIKGEKA